jgi:uncharacterized protein (DUF885 family)
MRQLAWAGAICLAITGCAPQPPQENFQKLAEEFVYTSLSYSPTLATQVGYHKHGNRSLDELLDNYSPAEIQRQRQWYEQLRLRLYRSPDLHALAPEDRADYELIQDQIALALLELNSIQNYRHNPTVYVELVGTALHSPHVLEYADKTTRYRHIVARLKQVPAFFETARRNLISAPSIWTSVAKAENDGNIALVDQTLRAGAPEELRQEYDRAARPAISAMQDFNAYLDNDLARRGYDWQLGADQYAQKFRFALATDQNPGQVLQAAETEMRKMRDEMYRIALPIYQKLHPGGAEKADRNRVILEVLQNISGRHATPDTYFADARRDLEEARQFIREKDLVTLPARANLQVIETPEFMRGIYAVGGFSPAPALEPQLGAFYWLTPIPKDWPAERIESKLREYNYYGLKLLTLHEAVPGHYLQFEYANDIQPPLRRLLRGVFGNGPYIEGWAVYATEMMLDQGYLGGSPELRLTFQKQQLRVLANAILDIRLQTMGMTDEQAMDLMIRDAFQEKEEATAKLQRAKLSSTQLPTYFVGWRDWLRLRSRYNAEKNGNLKQFHEAALKSGALPLPVLSRLLTGRDL